MSSTHSSSSGWEPLLPEELQRLLPQYEITAILGRGGMGAVYKGRQTKLNRTVAIKLLPERFTQGGDDLNFAKRFEQEAQAMAKLDHPAILSVYDFGETSEGQLYFVMEFVDGMDIHQYLQHHGGKLPQEHALSITAHVLDALDYAHTHGIVHRDIKPANILLNREGRVKIADFGLAKKFGEHADGNLPALTMSHIAVGTPDFVAPEALDSDRTPDHRADLYAVGVMLYQMLTGKLPRGIFQTPSELNPGIDSRLDDIVIRAMAADPDHRYPSATAVRADLDAVMSQPLAKVEPGEASGAVAVVVPVTTSVRGGKKLKVRSKRPVYLGIASVAVLVVGVIVLTTLDRSPDIPLETLSLVVSADTAETVEGTPLPAPKESGALIQPEEVPPVETTNKTPEAPQMVNASIPDPVPPITSSVPEKSVKPPAMAALAKPAVVPLSPAQTSTAPKPTANPLAAIPGFQSRLAAYLAARGTQLTDLATKYERGLDSRINQAADAGDLALVKVFREEQSLVADMKKSLADPPVDTMAAVEKSASLPALPDGSPESLVAMRTTWETEQQKIRDDLDGKLSISLQALEAELTRSRAFDQAEAVLTYRGNLNGRKGHNGTSTVVPSAAAIRPSTGKSGPFRLFDGKSLDGWRSVPEGTFFRVLDGAIRIEGRPADLFYEGSQVDALSISDFDLTMSVKTEGQANSGVFFHCVRKPDGSYERGPEFQIANENKDPQKTGSLWRVGEPVTRMPVRDGEWFEYRMVVSGKTATTYVDGRKLMEWIQPDDWTPPAERPGVRLGKGTFALQANGGIVWIKDIVLKLPVTPSAAASPRAGDPRLRAVTKETPFVNSLGMKFVPVPGTDVLFCVHETRWRDYAAYCAEVADRDSNWENQIYDGYVIQDSPGDHPVAFVSWEQSQAFCAWLSKKEGKSYRLPTDREWSVAVGIGSAENWESNTTPATVFKPQDEFPWGREWPPPRGAGNYSDQSRREKAPKADVQYLENYDDGYPTTSPVMRFEPNDLGLFDMGGNVWEWCNDWHSAALQERTLRGGSWYRGERGLMLSSYRGYYAPADRRINGGFRVVLVRSGN